MTRLRQTIARRLKEAQTTAAMLTTYNEVDMSAVMDLRKKYKDLFEKKHGVKLGFMGFFTKAVCHALKEIPNVNAEIDGTDIIYKNFCHIGVAVGTDKGLVVPVVRDADQLSIAGVEQEIGRLGMAARNGDLSMADMQGGTFTISNGGVYGSLMSSMITGLSMARKPSPSWSASRKALKIRSGSFWICKGGQHRHAKRPLSSASHDDSLPVGRSRAGAGYACRRVPAGACRIWYSG